MEKIAIKVKKLPHAENHELPKYATEGAAAFDLFAALPKDEVICLAPMQRCLVPTGLIFELPFGYEMQIRPRSGLALKNGITCLNTPGTIDSDYRGEIKILLINLGEEEFVIEPFMRVAQAVITKLPQISFTQVNELSDTNRGSGGFGSTGK